jgi:hypothetical protein
MSKPNLPTLLLLFTLALMTIDKLRPRIAYLPVGLPTPLERTEYENQQLKRELKNCLSGNAQLAAKAPEQHRIPLTPEVQRQLRVWGEQYEFRKRVTLFAQIALSLLFGWASLWVWLSKRYKPSDKHPAFATIGMIVGYWLGGTAASSLVSR